MIDFRQAHRNRLTWIALAWFVAVGGPCFGQASPEWKTGAALRKQLEASVSVAWEERPLREALTSLSQSIGVAVFLDRRIDPDQNVKLTVRDLPALRLLEQLAEKIDARVGTIGSVVYLGPQETASKLSTLAALRRKEAAALPSEVKARLLKTQAWEWDELAEPRNLLAELAQQGHVTIANPDELPHDLWPASDLPSLAWIDRLTLVLAGFGQTFELADGGATIRLVPIPEEVLVEKTYTPKGEPAPVVAQLRRIVPDATVRIDGRKLHVAAVQDDHDKIEKFLSGQSVGTTTVTPGEKRYSMTVENQAAGAVVKTVANQLGKDFKYDPQVVEKLQTKVSFVAKDVTLEELLAKALGPLKLSHRIDEQSLEVIPAE